MKHRLFVFLLVLLIFSSVHASAQETTEWWVYSKQLKKGSSFKWGVDDFIKNGSYTKEFSNPYNIKKGSSIELILDNSLAGVKKDSYLPNANYDANDYLTLKIDGIEKEIQEEYYIGISFEMVENVTYQLQNGSYETLELTVVQIVQLIYPTTIQYSNGTSFTLVEFLSAYYKNSDIEFSYVETDTTWNLSVNNYDITIDKEKGNLLSGTFRYNAVSLYISILFEKIKKIPFSSTYVWSIVLMALVVSGYRKRKKHET